MLSDSAPAQDLFIQSYYPITQNTVYAVNREKAELQR